MVDPAYLWIPPRVGSYGDEAVDLARLAGRELDEEQCLAVDAMLSYGPGGRWVALESGIVEPRQNGKCLAADTPVITANRGWVTLAEIVPGDRVFHPGGHDVSVIEAHPVRLGSTCYRVTTTDGRSVLADAEHLWTVSDARHTRTVGGRKVPVTSTLTTRQLLDLGLSRYTSGGRSVVTSGKRYTTNEYRFRLPVQGPVKSPDVDLPIDPYLFGAWLGDGTSAGGQLTCHVPEVDYWSAVIEQAGFVSSLHKTAPGKAACIGITSGREGNFTSALRSLGVLNNKHVPDSYLAAGTDQRLALLQGLMDTDGTISRQARSTRAEFCSTKEPLALAALYLARSLGWRATIITADATLYGRVIGKRWRVCWTPEVGDPVPFRMPRKAERIQPAQARAGELHAVSIKSIESVPSVPVRCIRVDSPDGLFLAGRDLVATHNTGGVLLPVTLFDLFLLPPDRIVWTAHIFRTARDAFNDFCVCIETAPELSRRVKNISYGHGEEFIELHSGAKLEFLARSKGGGRGLGGKRVVMDEALFIAASAMGALLPVLSARPDPQVNYGSSAALDTSDHLHRLKDRGRKGGDPSLIWIEFCAPGSWQDPPCEGGRACQHIVGSPRCALDDETLIAKANHTAGKRITWEYLRAERLALPPEEYGRERLGWHEDPPLTGGDIDAAAWQQMTDIESRREGDVTIGVDLNPQQTAASIALFGIRADGREHMQLMDHRPGIDWVPDRLVELRDILKPVGYAMGRNTYAALEAELKKSEFDRPENAEEPERGNVAVVAGSDMSAATGQMLTVCRPLIADGGALDYRARHIGQRELNMAVASARIREGGDSVGWSRKDSGGDITPLNAVTVAKWLYQAWAHLVVNDYDVMESVF